MQQQSILLLLLWLLLLQESCHGQLLQLATNDEYNGLDIEEIKSSFKLVTKSPPIIMRIGDNLNLECASNLPWELCSWKPPNGNWCHRLNTSKYQGSCFSNNRILYKVN